MDINWQVGMDHQVLHRSSGIALIGRLAWIIRCCIQYWASANILLYQYCSNFCLKLESKECFCFFFNLQIEVNLIAKLANLNLFSEPVALWKALVYVTNAASVSVSLQPLPGCNLISRSAFYLSQSLRSSKKRDRCVEYPSIKYSELWFELLKVVERLMLPHGGVLNAENTPLSSFRQGCPSFLWRSAKGDFAKCPRPTVNRVKGRRQKMAIGLFWVTNICEDEKSLEVNSFTLQGRN